MSLITPLLKAPLAEWSDSLLVEGALPGATVVARTIGPNPRDIAKDIVAGGRDRVALLPGVKLQEKDHILVRQVLGGEQSAWTPDHLGVAVGKVPADHGALAPLSFKSHAWECGTRVWVKGAVPGAQVVENQEEHADCSFDLQFKLEGVSSAFGAVLPGDLSGKGSTKGSVLQGVPSSHTFSRQDHFAAFSNPTYSEEVLSATHKFELFVSWDDYEGYPEEPEPEEKPEDDH